MPKSSSARARNAIKPVGTVSTSPRPGESTSTSGVRSSTTVMPNKPGSGFERPVSSVSSIFVGSSNEIGAFESGVAARLMGTVPSVIFGGTMTLIVVATVLFRSKKLREVREIQTA